MKLTNFCIDITVPSLGEAAGTAGGSLSKITDVHIGHIFENHQFISYREGTL